MRAIPDLYQLVKALHFESIYVLRLFLSKVFNFKHVLLRFSGLSLKMTCLVVYDFYELTDSDSSFNNYLSA